MDATLGLAFGAGALAIVNPCALGMIPASFALHPGHRGLVAASVGRLLRSPALARYGGGALLSAAGLYLLYLQLGFLIGYPFGIPAITLPL